MLDFLSIRQLVSSAVDESYEVVAPKNVVILRANMSFGFANVALHGMRRVIKVDMFDNEVNEVRVLRLAWFCNSFLYFLLSNTEYILIQFSILKPKL